jgi:hypothetical protein
MSTKTTITSHVEAGPLDISNGGQNHLVVAAVGRAHAATASGERISRKDSREIGLKSLIVSSGFGIVELR